MVIEEKKSDKTEYEYQMKAGNFDEMMRLALQFRLRRRGKVSRRSSRGPRPTLRTPYPFLVSSSA